MRFSQRERAVGVHRRPHEFVAPHRERAAPEDRDVDPVHLLPALLPAADAPAADGLTAAGHHAGHEGRLLLRLLAGRPSELDDDARQVLLRGELPQEQLAFQVAVGRDGDVILVFLAFVGDAEPPGLGLLELAQSPDERDVPVVGVALDHAEPHGVDRHGLTRLGVDRRPVDLVSLDHRELQVRLAGGDVESAWGLK